MFEDFEKVATHEHLAATEREKENSGLRQLIENALDFRSGQFTVVVVIEIAMHAALVAAIRDIQMDGERDAQVKRLLTYFRHQAHRTGSWGIGRSENG